MRQEDMLMSDSLYWLGFSMTPHVGTYRLAALWRAFGDLQTAWEAAPESLYLAGFNGAALASIAAHRPRLNLERAASRVERADAHLVTMADATYPHRLTALSDAPGLFYVRGRLPDSAAPALAIVGTRSATPDGNAAARQIARELAAQGVTIVSGLAEGIDAAAHEGALDVEGHTTAVLANGIDVIYPTKHRALSERIADRGALVTEFALGARPLKRSFPRRNRTLSGWADGVLIVEAPAKSGALYTANAAREQKRPVFVLEALIRRPLPNAEGLRSLADAGAHIVSGADDILSALGGAPPPSRAVVIEEKAALSTSSRLLDPNEQLLLDLLGREAQHTDILAQQMGISPLTFLGIITTLEIEGMIEPVGYSKYRRLH
jgi:DNA processing protein